MTPRFLSAAPALALVCLLGACGGKYTPVPLAPSILPDSDAYGRNSLPPDATLTIEPERILAGETAEGAVMFVPAEAVFAEIQAHHADLVETAQAARVWIASPTTLWAILNTASAVLKDASTRQQVHVIQEHLGALGVEFGRFRERMEKLSRHIRQANDDVKSVNTTAEKISGRFEKIERVELEKPETLPTGLEEPDD